MSYSSRKEYIEKELLIPFNEALKTRKNKKLRELFLFAINRMDAAEEFGLFMDSKLKEYGYEYDFKDFVKFEEDKEKENEDK